MRKPFRVHGRIRINAMLMRDKKSISHQQFANDEYSFAQGQTLVIRSSAQEILSNGSINVAEEPMLRCSDFEITVRILLQYSSFHRSATLFYKKQFQSSACSPSSLWIWECYRHSFTSDVFSFFSSVDRIVSSSFSFESFEREANNRKGSLRGEICLARRSNCPEMIAKERMFKLLLFCSLVIFVFICVLLPSLIKLKSMSDDQPTLSPIGQQIFPYLAMIADDRATPLLVNAVWNVLQHIPKDWRVQIVTLEKHWPFYQRSSLGPLLAKNRLFLTPLTISRGNLSGYNFINSVLTSASFWRQVPGKKVLVFQIDAVLCSNSPHQLTDFLAYDFIGAPWQAGGCCNGGLSLRNRTKILEMLEGDRVRFHLFSTNEDMWFSQFIPQFNGLMPSIPIAKTFSVETMYYPRPFAVHKPHMDTIGEENMKRLCEECPEVKTISSHCQELSKKNATRL